MRMKTKAITALALAGSLFASAENADVRVTAKIDSVETLQGLLRRIDIEVIQPDTSKLRWHNMEMPEQTNGVREAAPEVFPTIELRHSSAIDTTPLGNGRLQLNRTLLVQPWDSGEYVIPGLELLAVQDTFRSNPLALKVLPAQADSINSAQMMPVVEQEAQFWDFMPDWIYNNWWAILIAAVAVIAIAVILLRRRKGKLPKSMIKQERIVPPYEKAMARLEALQSKQLCASGQEKRFYTELTDILREYLEGRFGIFAMEMTTSQIKRAVYATVPEKAASKIMGEILEMSDYVKFAKMRPLPDDNVRAFTQARAFVESTRPQPEAGKEGKQ